MPDLRNPRSAATTFDPVCGTPLHDALGGTFDDGTRVHSFCCAMCRRIFIDEWHKRRKAEREKGLARVH